MVENRLVYRSQQMKKISILLLIFLSANLFSQDKLDSLLNLLDSATDTSMIKVLKELCWERRYSNPPEALRYGLEALSLLRQHEMLSEKAEINNYLGIIQRNVGDHATALEYFFSAQQIAEEHHFDRELAYAFNNIGDIYNREGKYQLALEYEMKALNSFETIGDSIGISYSCHQISLAYANLSEYSSALEYDLRAMKIRELLGNQAGVAYSLISIGQNYLKMGNESESLKSLLKSNEIFSGLNDKFGLSFSLLSTGMHYKMIGDNDYAIHYLAEALNLAKETDSPMYVRNSAQVLSELYAEQEKFKEAYQMHLLYKETYDSLYHEENLVKTTHMITVTVDGKPYRSVYRWEDLTQERFIECLPGKLNQVFMNILTNGILAIEGKGDIYIETSSIESAPAICLL